MTLTLTQQLGFIIEAEKMKKVFRQTLLLDGSRQENNAEHSWHFALAAMTLFPHAGFDGVDLNRVLKMAILHDLVEIYAGDTPAFDLSANTDKAAREEASAQKIFGLLPSPQSTEFRNLWEEFDAMETPSAQFAAAIDRLLPFLSNHFVDGHSWKAWGVTRAQVMSRMAIIKTAIPGLWPLILAGVEKGCAKGYIKE